MRSRILGVMTPAGAVAVVAVLLAVSAAGQAPARGQSPPSGGELTIAGRWNDASEGGRDRANYTLEFGWPETHAVLMGAPAGGRSLILDPPDGRIPFQPWAQAVRDARENVHEDWERAASKDIDPQAKCYPSGIPRLMNRDAPVITIFPDHVLMQFQWGHQYRVIYTDGRPRLSRHVKLWNGDSRGRWEGNVLVVETTNLNGYAWLDVIGSFLSDQATVIERFTPLDANTIRWTATVVDPTVFTRPWTHGWNYTRSRAQGADAEIWEYACAEGNRPPAAARQYLPPAYPIRQPR